MRIELEPAYVLHTRAYRNTSLLVDVFSRHYGKVSLVAKGAYRERSALASIKQMFCRLEINWVGQAELKTLSNAQLCGQLYWFQGKPLMSGLYLNELLLKLLNLEDPHPQLFDCYELALTRLNQKIPPEICLRLFEKALLSELGFGLDFLHEVDASGHRIGPIQPDRFYNFDPEYGLQSVDRVSMNSGSMNFSDSMNDDRRLSFERRRTGKITQVSGRTLLALHDETLVCREVCKEAKQFLGALIRHALGGRVLQSPIVWRTQQA